MHVHRGYQFRAGFLDGIKREVITIYEIIKDASNKLLYAVPDYQFKWVLKHSPVILILQFLLQAHI